MNFRETILLKKYRVIVGCLSALLLALLGAFSLHIYDYTENDPAFCVNCHIMEKPFSAWETSAHKGITCHDCHKATVLERNQMLFKALLERPLAVAKRPHEKIIVPGAVCVKCHLGSNGDMKKISKSTAHALHWFKASIECTSCHAKTLHNFAADQNQCLLCHGKNKIAFGKMQDMACTTCHDFRGNGMFPKSRTCLECHADARPPAPAGAAPQPHSQFECMTCHRTHDAGSPAKTSCRNCHNLAAKRGKHPIHTQALGDDCTACHQPHRWAITDKDARGLCAQCHKAYPLAKFG